MVFVFQKVFANTNFYRILVFGDTNIFHSQIVQICIFYKKNCTPGGVQFSGMRKVHFRTCTVHRG